MTPSKSGLVQVSQLAVDATLPTKFPRRIRRAFRGERVHLELEKRGVRGDHLSACKEMLKVYLHFAEFMRGRGDKARMTFGMLAVPEKVFARVHSVRARESKYPRHIADAVAARRRVVRCHRTLNLMGLTQEVARRWKKGGGGKCSIRRLTPAFFRLFPGLAKMWRAPSPRYENSSVAQECFEFARESICTTAATLRRKSL